jgi:hypothetical protein
MGLMTFAELQNDIAENLAGKNLNPARLKRFVNNGIQDLCTRMQFDELFVTEPFFVQDGVTTYPVPTDLLGIHAILINGTLLRKMERQWSEKDVTPAQPSYYKRREAEIIVWAEPDQFYEGYIEYYKVPPQLTEGTDVTLIPKYWDQAIVFLGTYHGWLSLGELDTAETWKNAFARYQNKRLTDEDISADIQHEGLNVAWEYSHLVDNPPHVS